MLTSAEVVLPMVDKICTLTCCLPIVHQKLGYIEIVGRAAEMSMYPFSIIIYLFSY